VNPHSAATLSTLLLFFLSLAILAGLFATVHRREIETVKAYREKTRVDRMDRSIEQWLNGGFFRYGGMFLMDREQSIAFYPEQLPPPSEIPASAIFPYRNGTASYLIPAYWVQWINYKLSGQFSTRLMLVYNQFLIALMATALGALSFKLARSLGLGLLHSLALAASCLLAYQTFAPALARYWEVSHLSIGILFTLIFLNVEFGRWETERSPWQQLTRSLLAFLVIFGEPATGGSFIVFYLWLRAFTSDRGLRAVDVITIFIVPVIALLAYIGLQHALVHHFNEAAFTVGSSLISRMGLDGDTRWYTEHWDLLRRAHLRRLNMPFAPLVEWRALMLAGSLGMIFLLIRYSSDLPAREPIRTLLATVGLFVPFAFIFSQGAIIHPHYYDLGLVVPFILAAFCVGPAYLETRFRAGGLVTFLATVASAAYAFVQLRTYVIVFPPAL
jgi:hypothetical protein